MNSANNIKLIASSKKSNILNKINEIYLDAVSNHNEEWVKEHHEEILEEISTHINHLITNKNCPNIQQHLNNKRIRRRRKPLSREF